MALLTPEQATFVQAQRVGHLATTDAAGQPHVVPVCFALDGEVAYMPIDLKPKRTFLLKRVRNIRENPRVALLFHRYDNAWLALGWVMLHGTASLLPGGEEHRRAIALLRSRYPQYRDMALEEAPVIRVQVERAAIWGNLALSSGNSASTKDSV